MKANIVLAVLLLSFSTALSAQTTIGLILPLTGPRASIGEDARAGALLALEALRSSEAACPLNVSFEDSHGDPAAGISAFEKLSASGVKIVVTQNSGVSLPISPLANARRIIQMAITTTSDAYSSPDDYTFRTNGGTVYEAATLADYIEKQSADGSSCTGILTMEDEFPRSLHENLVRELARRKVQICLDDNFLPKETDYRSLITKFLVRNGRVMACLGYQVECGLLLKQLRQATQANVAFVGVTPVNNTEFFQAADGASEGAAVSYIKVDTGHVAASEYSRKYGRKATVFSANAYDSIFLLSQALSSCECRPEPECLKRALFSIKNFHGMSGVKSFDDHMGDMEDQYEILVARGGEFVPDE